MDYELDRSRESHAATHYLCHQMISFLNDTILHFNAVAYFHTQAPIKVSTTIWQQEQERKTKHVAVQLQNPH